MLDKIALTDEDRILISQLASYPLKSLAQMQIMRRDRKENPLPDEKLVSIDDLCISELQDILHKIDIYVQEIHGLRSSLGSLDEVWMLEYWALKDTIKEKLGGQNLEEEIRIFS